MRLIINLLFVSIIYCSLNNILIAQEYLLEDDYLSLIAAEKAFSKTSELLGTRDAFLTYLADDAIVFRPQPVNGIDVWKNAPRTKSSLLWKPVFADISSSGDFGFTTGPWEYGRNREDQHSVAYGYYITVWQRNKYGLWKVAIDGGNSFASPEPNISEKLDFDNKRIKKTEDQLSLISVNEELLLLLDKDREFSIKSQTESYAKAFFEITSQNVRVYRDNQFPHVGKEACEKIISEVKGSWWWEPIGGDVSKAGDLGFSYGKAKHTDKNITPEIDETYSYFRIWEKELGENWTLIIDLLIPASNDK